jgi:predicted HTH transcriptional regulator
MRWNIREAKVDKNIEQIILKSIAAFSNSEGGKLLIGVADDGEILGLEEDYNTLKEANKDHFELHLRNLINKAYGRDFATTNIRIKFPGVDEAEICEVEIKAGMKPLYLEVAPTSQII